jgi:hypothetical protein
MKKLIENMVAEILDTWLKEVKSGIGKKYHEIEHFGIFAKDENFADLIETDIEQSSSGYKGKVIAPYYAYWLEHGRGPTVNRTPHNPTVRMVVLRWIKKYGIQSINKKYNQSTLAYFISKSIHEHGIKVPGKYNPGGLISDVITKERIEDLRKQLTIGFIENIKSEVLKSLK